MGGRAKTAVVEELDKNTDTNSGLRDVASLCFQDNTKSIFCCSTYKHDTQKELWIRGVTVSERLSVTSGSVCSTTSS